MKQLFFAAALVLVCAGVVSAQVSGGQTTPIANPGQLFKTYTTYTATSDDTTGWVTINLPGWSTHPLWCSEVWLIGRATDSVAADVNVIGRNSTYTATTVTYADSFVAANTGAITATPATVTIQLKGPTLDRLPGCDQFKVGTVFANTGHSVLGQGTSTGRTVKWYVGYRYP